MEMDHCRLRGRWARLAGRRRSGPSRLLGYLDYKKIARPTTPDEPKLWQLPGWVRDMVPSPDGRYLATANCDGSVYILRLDSLFAAEAGEP
jgi:hypothetical protein